MAEEDSKLMRPAEAAKALSVSKRQIYHLIAQGTVPHIKIGRNTIRLHRDVIAKIVQEGTAE